MSSWVMRYQQPAADSIEGWEHESLPLGNGFLGACVFGGVNRERIQITENTLENEGKNGGLTNFAELYFTFPHKFGDKYLRTLDSGDAEATVSYEVDGVRYDRRYFASYPNRVLVMQFTAPEGQLSMEAALEIPFCGDYSKTPGDGAARTGQVTMTENSLIMAGKLTNYQVEYRGELRLVSCDGEVKVENNGITIRGASEAVFLFACATNYELRPELFLEKEPAKKLRPFDPYPIVDQRLDDAEKLTWAELRKVHRADFHSMFNRVQLDLGESQSDEYTDVLMARYQAGDESAYLEALYFQYGRYLLIASSRPSGMPANLQGIWNAHRASPWGSGYWFNINIQMNYWPAFLTNLAECFEPMVDYMRAAMLKAEQDASKWVKATVPEQFIEGQGSCGWAIGTGCYPYSLDPPAPRGSHSGPGTGGLTSKLFWEYYDFTRDENVLRHVAYPMLRGMSKYLTRTVREYDGLMLAAYSASPEQLLNGHWLNGGAKYYNTVGCSFDQQMIAENGRDFLAAADLLGIDNADVARQRSQQDEYDPILIGWDGQIKEYREENFYGEFGEQNHRHISQLVALMPGTMINMKTDAWMDAAKTTLNLRGDRSTGWAMAHRINAWARTGDGNRSYALFRTLLRRRTNRNLWDMHPPFQIDGNFGGCAAIAEMLLQSHDGCVRILPALPDCWLKGKVSGLCARGAFEIDIEWEKLRAKKIVVHSKKGTELKLVYSHIRGAQVTDGKGNRVDAKFRSNEVCFATEAGGVYEIIVPEWKRERPADLTGLQADKDNRTLTWDAMPGVTYSILRAVDGEPTYTTIASDVQGGTYVDESGIYDRAEIVMYKVIPWKNGECGQGQWITLNHATKLQRERHANIMFAKLRPEDKQ